MSLSQVPLLDLVDSCRQEMSKFQHGEPSKNEFCWEIMRRAVCERDEVAWSAVLTQYRRLVIAWVRQHPASASSQEGDDYWVNRVFERLWMAVGPERFSHFPDLPSLLKYLKMCVHSVLLDDARARRAYRLESLDSVPDSAISMDVESQTVGEVAGRELWQLIAEEVPDETERMVVYCSFALGMKPGEIQERNPDRYPTTADVYRIKRSVLDRLRRSQRLRQVAA